MQQRALHGAPNFFAQKTRSTLLCKRVLALSNGSNLETKDGWLAASDDCLLSKKPIHQIRDDKPARGALRTNFPLLIPSSCEPADELPLRYDHTDDDNVWKIRLHQVPQGTALPVLPDLRGQRAGPVCTFARTTTTISLVLVAGKLWRRPWTTSGYAGAANWSRRASQLGLLMCFEREAPNSPQPTALQLQPLPSEKKQPPDDSLFPTQAYKPLSV